MKRRNWKYGKKGRMRKRGEGWREEDSKRREKHDQGNEERAEGR